MPPKPPTRFAPHTRRNNPKGADGSKQPESTSPLVELARLLGRFAAREAMAVDPSARHPGGNDQGTNFKGPAL
jgi:hypothetical protein